MFAPHFLTLVAAFGLLSANCDYEYIKAVGGIKIGQVTRKNDGSVWLPVQCNVGMDSGAVIKSIKAKVRNNQIHILVVRTFPHGDLSCRHDAPVRLGKIKPGSYKVFYDSKKDGYPSLGDIEVPAE